MKKLPKKWCIKRNQNSHKEINEWFTNKYKIKFTAKTDFHSGWKSQPSYWSYLHEPRLPSGTNLANTKHPEYTEITFEQFKKFVYKKKIRIFRTIIK
jgi:hypothetical protein